MKKGILYVFPLFVSLLGCSCSSDDSISVEVGSGGEDITGGVTEVTTVTSSLMVELSTDKACYSPGETVTFTASTLPSGAKIRYRQAGNVVSEQEASGLTWTWTAPSTDFTGYLVDIYSSSGDNSETVYGSIAVDVSSDWTTFPRYGFVATFGSEKTDDVIAEEMAFLNRCHINGVQFQDWHNKHHWPLGGTRNELYDVYKDIANRDIYTSVVKKYIEVQHAYGMKSMFYNLCFGALEDAADDGVQEEWYIFKGTGHTDKDCHSLPSSWKSSIYLLNPANTEWQSYIIERNDEVYSNLDFDGYQIDQLGERGTRYDYSGSAVNLLKGYASFINAVKTAHPQKRLVMNAVSSYGASQIAGTGNVDFLYNEVWGDEADFEDLRTIIKANDQYSSHSLKTVFAAYMNYDKADNTGEFNTPGVLLTDAVMFALGGAHLELGDHMLCKEYFPNTNLSMTSELRNAIIRYYDFMTAYQNLLRGEDTAAEVTVVPTSTGSTKVSTNVWPPETGGVTTYSKEVDGKRVVNLLNFINADSLSWRDLSGTMPAPKELTDVPMKMNYSTTVSKMWVASPDYHAGAPQELAFEQADGVVTFTLPALKYWTMLVIQ